jgi:drug/metabolite transporter (DMT)-like permease
VLGFACAFCAMFRGVHLIGATPTAMVMNTEPVFTIALAVTLLSEGLSGRKVVGAALVLAAVAVSQVLARRDARSGVPA